MRDDARPRCAVGLPGGGARCCQPSFVLSGSRFGLVAFEAGDNGGEVVGGTGVHLREPGLAATFGAFDDVEGELEMFAMLGQELGVVMKTGQLGQALACGQLCCSGSPQ